MSNSLWPHGPQHARLPCPSPTPRVYSLMSVESVMPSNHLILCHPLLLPPSILPSIRVFSNESAICIRWPKDWGFSFNISPSNGHPGLICFRMDWLDPFAVQGTLKSLLQHHSSKASILQRSAFLIVQLSHPYMTTGKTIALVRQTTQIGSVYSWAQTSAQGIWLDGQWEQLPGTRLTTTGLPSWPGVGVGVVWWAGGKKGSVRTKKVNWKWRVQRWNCSWL